MGVFCKHMCTVAWLLMCDCDQCWMDKSFAFVLQELEGLKVDDEHVVEMSSAAGVDSPYMLLCEFVHR